MSGNDNDDIPFYLMPVAAVFAMYSAVAAVRALYLVYANVTHKSGTIPPSTRLNSRAFLFLVLSILGSAFMYAKVVASVENAMESSSHALFDPYDILAIPTNANSTIVKKAYRDLSKQHHPDKGGSENVFHKIHLAYRALTDASSKENYKKYGHPDGPPSSRALSFALPPWLLHPEGTTAVVLVLLYLGMFASLIYVVISWSAKKKVEAQEKEASNSVAGADVAYLTCKLLPDSTHMDVLFYIATSPESIHRSQTALDKMEKIKAERLLKKVEEKNNKTPIDFDLKGGWAEDVDDLEEDEDAKAAALKAKEAEEQLAKERAARIAAATGNQEILLEGVDDGVLGQQWVERILQSKKQWPPPNMSVLEGVTFGDSKGNAVSAMDHPAVRRNLCMTMGRLNSQHLNTHPELLHAGANKLVDGFYFRSSMEYRQRCGLLLEACLRVALMAGSYRLAKTIVETVAMFKVGTTSPNDKRTVEAFEKSLKQQYGGDAGLPRLVIKNCSVSTADEDEIATGDISAVQLELERTHAENFTKQKVALCQKQGIPPQVALKSYREGWWILIRAKRLDGKDAERDELPAAANNPLEKLLEDGASEKFKNEVGENRLITAWPLIVQNVAQKGGKVKIQFKAPPVPGRYRFYVAVKSQEFLGADQELTVDQEVVDVADVKREEADEKEDQEDNKEENGEDDVAETKKDK